MDAENSGSTFGWLGIHDKHFDHLSPFSHTPLDNPRSIRLVKLPCKKPDNRNSTNGKRYRSISTSNHPASTLTGKQRDDAIHWPLRKVPAKRRTWEKLLHMNSRSGTVELPARKMRRIGNPNDERFWPLNIELHEFVLDQAPPYEAISYVWGPTDARAIICNGSRLMIGCNCALVLYHLSCDYNQDMCRWIWIDQICIDQHDLAEKSHQVGSMAAIYKQAVRTVAWLGPSNEQNEKCMNQFDKISRDRAYSDYPDENRFLHPDMDFSASTSIEWFRRGWITQEAGLSRTLDLMCGDWICPWEVLYLICTLMRPLDLKLRKFKNDIERLNQLRLRTFTGNLDISISDAFRYSRSTLTYDPLDKLYALRGLSSELAEVTGLPDYTQSPAELYHEFTLSLVRKQGTVSPVLWGLIASCAGRNSMLDLPSWVPDLSRPHEGYQWPLRFAHHIEPNDLEILTEHALTMTRISGTVNRNLLTCQCIIFDKLSEHLWNSPAELDSQLRSSAKPKSDAAIKQLDQLTLYGTEEKIDAWKIYEHNYYMPFFEGFLQPQDATTGYMYNETEVLGGALWSTGNHHLAVVPQESSVGDTIACFPGAVDAFVIRHDNEHWRLVGPCDIYELDVSKVLEAGERTWVTLC